MRKKRTRADSIRSRLKRVTTKPPKVVVNRSKTGPPPEKSLAAGVLLSPLALGLGAPAFGAEGYFSLAKNAHLGVAALHGSASLKSQLSNAASTSDSSSEGTSVDCTKADISATQLLVNLRYFFGQTFYIAPGLGWRRFNSSIAFEDTSANANYVDINAVSDSVVASFAIGNIWRLGNGLYLGGEWAAYQYPVSASYTTTTSTHGTIVQVQDQMTTIGSNFAQDLARAGTSVLLTFVIGMAI